MTLIKICSGKGQFNQSGGSFFQNFPWHFGPNHGGSSDITKYLAPPLFQTCPRPYTIITEKIITFFYCTIIFRLGETKIAKEKIYASKKPVNICDVILISKLVKTKTSF